MCRPTKWVWGLLPLLLLGLVIFWARSSVIEEDLAARTNAERRAEGHRWARVQMDGRELSLTGVAPTEVDREQMINIAQSIRGVRTVTDDTELLAIMTPYTFSAERQERNLVLSGFVSNDAMKKRIVDLAKAANPDWRVKNELELGRGAPENFEGAVESVLNTISQLDQGGATMTDTEVAVQGEAAYQSLAENASQNLASSLPSGFHGTADISIAPSGTPVDLVACQELFNAAMDGKIILFETGNAAIDQESMQLLDDVILIARRCPDGKVDIVGYTDSDGDAESNRLLSRSRASSVRDVMVAAGIDARRLTAIGYGEADPVADNNTPAGKAANRRIEFRVVRASY